MTEPTPSIVCPSCDGGRWKYVTLRSEIRAAAVRSGGMSRRELRTCMDCRGTGLVAVRSS